MKRSNETTTNFGHGDGNKELDMLLQRIFKERNMDFREYKKTSLRRRIQKRLEANSLTSYSDYMKVLDRKPEEYNKLFEALFINVTEFFRDPEAWQPLGNEVVRKIIASKKKGDSIRVWSAGCASGEEPYSVGILFAEALRDLIQDHEIRIYATDIDTAALEEARRGIYAEDKIKNVRAEILGKYFRRENGKYAISKTIRKMVVFGQHNLTTDAPISHMDLILCRNVLIYFDLNLQNKVITRFHYAMNPNGYVFFGKSESMFSGSRIFRPVDKKWRIFQKVPEIMVELTRLEGRRAAQEQSLVERAITEAGIDIKALDFFFQRIVQNIGLAIIAIDKDKVITTMNNAWADMWSMKREQAVGKSVHEADLTQRLPALDKWIHDAMKENRTTKIEEVEITDTQGDKRYFDITLVPMLDPNQNQRGTIIISNDETEHKKLLDDLTKSNDELQSLNERLETTNEELVSSNEELETTTEELQSTAEELETSNEELQSSNEELETTNEELMSTNEELETTNDELAAKTELVNLTSLYYKVLIDQINQPIILLDKNFNVTALNTAAKKTWVFNDIEIIGGKLSSLNPHLSDIVKTLKKGNRMRTKQETERVNDTFEFATPVGGKKLLKLHVSPIVDADKKTVGTIVISEEMALKNR